MSHPRRRSSKPLSPNAVSLAVASCFALSVSTAYANPNGFAVVNGQATFNYNGNTLSVTNTPGSIINWQGFSIGANELTRFIQQSAASSVLNRVVGADPSQILGALQSNGRVFLINPSGIVFGAGAQVDVAGLVASTLNLSNADFLAGRFRFTEVPGAGSVVNNGSITTPAGGQVYLIAPNVQNSGIVTSPRGEVILAAGRSVDLVDAGSPGLRVEITAPDNAAMNVGQIMAASGKVGIYAGLIRAGGAIRADGVVAGQNGEILLKATRNTTVDAGSTISASGAQGGKVTIQSGDTTLVAGSVEAKGSAGQGGTVQLLGNRVGVTDNAVIDASGRAGGGTVLVGGDYQGRNAAVQNAYRTYVGPTASLNADAIESGDGGKVIVWSDNATRVYGSISARGGAQSGNGGFVETSGHALEVTKGPDVRAPHGAAGTWLLDPVDLTVVAGGSRTNNSGAPFFDALGDDSKIGVDLINSQLDFGSNVLLTTTSQGLSDGLQAGNITVSAPILKKAATTLGPGGIVIGTTSLTMQAHNNIVIDAAGSITSTGDPLNVTLIANSDNVGGGGVTIGGAITTRGGVASVQGRDLVAVNAPINTLSSTGTGGGSVSLTSSAGAVQVSSAVTSGSSLSASGFTGVSINASLTSASTVSLNSSTGAVGVAAPVSAGFFSASSGGGSTLTLAAPVTSTTGAQLFADDMDIQGVLNAGTGAITVQQSLAGRPMNLGSNTAGALSLTQAELTNLVTSGAKTFGNSSTGAFTVSAPVSVGSSSVSLLSGTSVSFNAGLTTAVPLTVNAPAIAVGGAVSAQTVNFTTDTIAVNAPVTSVTDINVSTRAGGRAVNLGVAVDGAGSLDFTPAELGNLVNGSTNALRINASGALAIQGAISRTGTQALALFGSSITQPGAGATLNVTNLKLTSSGSIILPLANTVGTLAGFAAGVGGQFTFANAAGTLLTIGVVDGTNGLRFNQINGTINLSADNLNVASSIAAPFSNGAVVIQPVTATTKLNLGGADAAGTLGISPAELALISATTLTLKANEADITAAVTSAASTLAIAPLTTRPLNIEAGPGKNAANLEFTPGDIANVTASSFTLGDATTTGPVTVNTPLTVPAAKVGLFTLRTGDAGGINVLSPLAANNVALTANAMALNNAVTANAGGSVTIATNSAVPIDLGSNPGPGTLGLNAAELGGISASALILGDSVATGMTVTAALTFANAGSVTLATGGTLAINASTGLTNTSPAADINLTANTMTVGSTVTSAGNINVGPISNSGIFLGTKPGGALGLTSGELDLFAPGAGKVLRIGNSSTAGMTISAAIAPSGTSILSLVNGSGGVGQSAPITGVSNLAVQSSGGITLNQNNSISESVALDGGFGAISFKQVGGALNIGTVDGVTGVRTSSGAITLQSDLLNIGSSISAASGSSNVSLLPVTTTLPISLGVAAKSGGALELTNTELNAIDASTLSVGNTTTGSITVAGAVNLNSPAGPSSLSLVTAPANTIAVNGALTVPNGSLTFDTGTLTTTAAVSARDSINLTANTLTTGANVVSTAGSITAVAGSMDFNGGPNSVSAPGNITLRPRNASTVIDLGGADDPFTTNTLGLDGPDMAALAPGQFVIGGSSVPSITVTAGTNLGTKPTTLTTIGGGTGTINVNAALTTGDLTLTTDNLVIPGGGSIAAPNVTLKTASTNRTVDLGTPITGTALGLDQTQLNRITSPASFTIDNFGPINVSAPVSFATSNLTLLGDTMTIGNTVTNGGGGRIIVAPASNFRPMNLGTNPAAGALGLTPVEITRFITTGVLQLGEAGINTGSILISESIAPASGVSTLMLAANGSITQSVGKIITAANLRLQSSGQINLPEANVVGTLAGGNTGSNYAFTGAGLLTIGPMVDTVSGLQGGPLTLRADDLAIVGPGTISNSIATLAPRNTGAAMNLGSSPGGVFGVDATELTRITGSTLTFGSTTAGSINVSSAMNRASGTLNLVTGATQAINVNASLLGPSGVTLTGGSTNIGAAVSTAASGSVTITSDSISIGAPITSPSGGVTLQPLTAARPIDVGSETSGALSLTSNEINLVNAQSLVIGSNSAGPLNVSAPIMPTTVTNLTLRSGGAITQSPGAAIVTKKVVNNVVQGSLSVFAVGSVDLREANDVGTFLSGSVSGPNSNFAFNNVSPIKLQQISISAGKRNINAGVFVPSGGGEGADDTLSNDLIAGLNRATDFSAFDKDKEEEDKKSDEKQISRGLNAMCRP